jgi:HEAT repeat protein
MNNSADNPNSNIRKSIADLASHDQGVREKAHYFLTSSGEPAVEALIEALSSSNSYVRQEAGQILDGSEFDWSKHTDKKTLNTLIKYLISNDGFVRLSARNSLVKIGLAAVSELVSALASKRTIQRWEAAKALSQIGDPAALPALVTALNDKEFDVRWVAAEGLIAIGTQSIKPLLQLIIDHSDSIRLREGVHHVLYALNNEKSHEILKPVLDALEGPEAPLQVPFAAEKALKALKL